MKRMLVLLSMLSACAFTQAQTSATASASLVVTQTEHNFGSIAQGKPVYHTFTIVNRSSKAIKLDGVSASCGCTTPEWSKAPIAPGGSTAIKVGFNAADSGPFERYVTIQYGGNQTAQLKIKGTVWTPPAGAAPPNAAVQFLKQQTQ